MKRTKTMWAVFFPDGEMYYSSLSSWRKKSIQCLCGQNIDIWKIKYKQGCRCRKVKIEWEE